MAKATNTNIGDSRMKYLLWLEYDDGRRYQEECSASLVPVEVKLSVLRDSARQAGNRVIKNGWSEAAE
jgi:hypothetical protein